ncbi:hypothetical protein BJX68DRAFT_262076 [Aspergillus pseudodeflectus]|uniref:CYTH domain-containing protein n=1 Tax=Aspergillus pseudodeflectus TaxID=176178 RepID=A0ABR4L5N5_9EURO
MPATIDPRPHATPNMEPEYEVRLQLNPATVLDNEHKLKQCVLSTFNMPKSVKKLNVQFLDTDCKEIYSAGWSPRIRKTEKEEELELTYKKRYPITGTDIDAALNEAAKDGFDAGAAKYEAQVEWGYQKHTLSISRKKSVADPEDDEMDLPKTRKSQKLLIDEAPDKFNNWKHCNWGAKALSESRIFGPVLARRSIGTWSGMKLFVEVWPLLNAAKTDIEHIVEASFKTESRTTAFAEQRRLAEVVQSKGWFLPEDALKTHLIMQRY